MKAATPLSSPDSYPTPYSHPLSDKRTSRIHVLHRALEGDRILAADVAEDIPLADDAHQLVVCDDRKPADLVPLHHLDRGVDV